MSFSELQDSKTSLMPDHRDRNCQCILTRVVDVSNSDKRRLLLNGEALNSEHPVDNVSNKNEFIVYFKLRNINYCYN